MEENAVSLYEEAFEKCTILDKRTTTDTYGGYKTQWVPGAEIDVAVVYNTSLEARIAQAQNVTDVYTLLTKKNINLEYHTVLRRQNGMVLRVTTQGDDNKTPASAGLNMREVRAEEWILTDE